jgi:TonB-dependent starch-binding outer membrane protein SusC
MIKRYRLFNKLLFLCLWLISFQVFSQSLRTVSGTVKGGDDGTALPGVNILEKGSTNGTVTDSEGNYSINVHENAILVFSFVGYASQEIPVGTQSQIKISLELDIATLNEVMVIGYGTVKKTDATGSLSVIDTRSFNKGVVNSPQELLMGKTAGVLVTSNSGAPGNVSTIMIRGGSSLSASNDPLIVIDGVPVSNNNLGGSPNMLATINPNDIESYTVLKDASATAIYGLRASNGVIIITTKKGGKEMKIDYTATGTVFTAPKKVQVFNGDEYRALVQQHLATNPAAVGLLGSANTNWQKEIYRKSAFGQDHNLGVSGTAWKTPYRVSFGYNNTDGILKTYNFERTTLSLGLDPSLLNNHLKVNINVKGMINNNNFADQGAIGNAIGYDPTRPVYNGNTRWRGYTSWTQGGINDDANPLAMGNPVAMLMLTDNTSTVKRSIGSIKFDYEVPAIKNLHAILNLAYDYTDTKGHNNVPDSTQWTPGAAGRFNPYSAQAKNQLLDLYVSYAPDLKSTDHKMDVMGGYSWSHFYVQGGDSTMNAKQEGPADRVNIYKSEYYLLSFFGRVNYTFRDKYLFTATLRSDGTSRFEKSRRFGLFPAVGLGWKINEEPFLKGSKTISELKLRLGYGITGQQDIVGNDYPYIATYTRSDDAARYPFGNVYYNTLRPDAYNETIQWETAETINAALDYGFFGNRITGSLDVYRKKSYDLISYVPPAQGTNFGSSVISNIGNITNHGVELNINAEVISKEDLQWTVGYNITYNKNEVTKLTLNNDPKFLVAVGGIGGTTSGTIQAHRVGYPRRAYYTYQQVYDDNGKPLEDVYVDRNNDGVINTDDLYSYKQPDPIAYMGINSRVNYKNFDFSFSGRANLGNYVYNNVAANSTYRALYDIGILMNVSKLAEKTQFDPATNTRFSDYYVENASFFRMDNINLGYTFREVFKDKLNIRIGAGAQNVFVITKYSGLDPEVEGGRDNNFFPRTRSFFLNLNCTF